MEQHPKVQTGRRQGDWMVGAILYAIRENEKVTLLADPYSAKFVPFRCEEKPLKRCFSWEALGNSLNEHRSA